MAADRRALVYLIRGVHLVDESNAVLTIDRRFADELAIEIMSWCSSYTARRATATRSDNWSFFRADPQNRFACRRRPSPGRHLDPIGEHDVDRLDRFGGLESEDASKKVQLRIDRSDDVGSLSESVPSHPASPPTASRRSIPCLTMAPPPAASMADISYSSTGTRRSLMATVLSYASTGSSAVASTMRSTAPGSPT